MANSPSPRIAISPAIQALDIQVVAGKSYLFTACAGTVAIYKWGDIRMGGEGGIIPKGEHLVLVKTLDLQQIFIPLFGPDDPTHPRPHNVNVSLAQAWNWRPDPNHPNDPRLGVIPCFVEDPFDWRGNLFEPDAKGNPSSKRWTDQNPVSVGGDKKSRYLPTSSCICDAPYDVRLAYDGTRDVYFIGGPRETTFGATCPAIQTPARRQTLTKPIIPQSPRRPSATYFLQCRAQALIQRLRRAMIHLRSMMSMGTGPFSGCTATTSSSPTRGAARVSTGPASSPKAGSLGKCREHGTVRRWDRMRSCRSAITHRLDRMAARRCSSSAPAARMIPEWS